MSLAEQFRLPPEVNQIIYVRNLPLKITSEQLYEIFGKYGGIRQIRRGIAADTKGSAFVAYQDIFDAKNAVDHLKGLQVAGKYLIVNYLQKDRILKRAEIRKAKQEIENLKKEYKTTQ
jgi:pre-mRNA branch site protein p14